MNEAQKQRFDRIVELLKKHLEKIASAAKGKIEINFSGSKLTISVTIFEESVIQ